MRRRSPSLSALLVAGALVAVGCSAGGDEPLTPAATVGTAPAPPPTSLPPVDPAVIPADPAEIDERYVQAVVDALFAVDAKATEIFVETKTLDQRAIDYLAAIYVGEELDRQADAWFKTFARGSQTLLPGPLRNDVTRLVSVSPDCTFIAVERDYSLTSTSGTPPRTVYLGLSPKAPDDDPMNLNPTAWVLFSDGFNVDGSQPEDPCTTT